MLLVYKSMRACIEIAKWLVANGLLVISCLSRAPVVPSSLPLPPSTMRMMIIQLRRFCVHDLLRPLHRVLAMQSQRRLLGKVIIRMVFGEQVFDFARACRSLIYCKAGGEFLVGANLDCVQQEHGKVLAVVCDEVVGCSFGAHVVDGHVA